jgi:hypothetical protein
MLEHGKNSRLFPRQIASNIHTRGIKQNSGSLPWKTLISGFSGAMGNGKM